MFTFRASVICTSIIFCLITLASCAGLNTTTRPVKPATPATPASAAPAPSPTVAHKPDITPITTSVAPAHYTPHVFLRGVGRPDDLIFDQQGSLLFSDPYNGTISRVNRNGSVTVILRGLAAPEGLVVLRDGTLIIAEQQKHRILALAPGAPAPFVLHALPGIPSTAHCKDGVDGIALDPTNDTLIIPDSPTGEVYRMSRDGKLTLLASGIPRPVGAAVDAQGNVYLADECGGSLWRIAPGGKPIRMANFGMLDDVVLDTHGNALVIDLKPSIHALIRMNLTTGKQETLASRGFIEPQGLMIDAHDNIYVSDDYANVIMKYTPA